MTPNPIVEAATRFRGQLITGQNDASNQMLDTWAQVLKNLEPKLAAVQREMEADGETSELVFEEQRLQRILADVAQEVEKYAAKVEPLIADRQREAIELAQQHAKDLTLESLDPAPAGARATWSTVDPGTLENLVGLTAEGSPFADELVKVASTASDRVRSAMLLGFATGRTPAQILSGVRDAVAGHVGRFLTVARTAEMHAYTLSQFESFQENSNVVTGWRWHSSLSFDTCLACMALHGREFPLGAPMERHFNCRCIALPITKTWEELGYPGQKENKREWTTGEDWLQAQPKSIQLRALGKTRLDLIESGQVSLDDFLGHADYPQWGGMYYERSTQSALASAQARDILFDQSAISTPRNGAEARKILADLQAQSAQAIIDFETKVQDGQKRLNALVDEIKKARLEQNDGRASQLIVERFETMAEIRRLKEDQQAFIDNHLATVRERVVFVDNPSQVAVTQSSKFDKARKAIYDQALVNFGRMVDAALPPQADLILKAKRGYRSAYDYRIFTMKVATNCDERTFIHEMGHWLESHNPDIQRKAFEFLERRTKGSPVERLRDLLPKDNYDATEVTKQGGFFHPYVGKQYINTITGERYGSEIVSMGMEEMFVNPEGFALKDPDHFDFIFDLLRGL